MITGFLNIDKDEGISSAFVVGRIKYKLKQKCGHMGTLDPLASGVLPIGVGKSTRLFNYLLEKEKEYITDFTFGQTTDTLDRGGNITDTTKNIPNSQKILLAIKTMTGEVLQMPPKFSAKNINGRRGYDLARQGIEFQLEPKKVIIDSIELIEQKKENIFSFKIKCGGGTYIRSICRDLAEKTNSLAYMSALRRTVSGIFKIENSIKLNDFLETENTEEYFIQSDSLTDYKKVYLDNDKSFKLLNGIGISIGLCEGYYRLYDSEFIGIGEVNQTGLLKIKSLLR
jgi:tRNA pseudouridine55 synthase